MGSVYIWTHVRYVYFQCVYLDIRPICICPVCILGHTSDMYTFSVYTRSHVRYVYFQCVYLDKRPICILPVCILGPTSDMYTSSVHTWATRLLCIPTVYMYVCILRVYTFGPHVCCVYL